MTVCVPPGTGRALLPGEAGTGEVHDPRPVQHRLVGGVRYHDVLQLEFRHGEQQRSHTDSKMAFNNLFKEPLPRPSGT